VTYYPHILTVPAGGGAPAITVTVAAK